MTIEQKTVWEYNGVLYDTEHEALDAKEQNSFIKSIEDALDSIYYYGRYNLGSAEELIELLDKSGLKIVKEGE